MDLLNDFVRFAGEEGPHMLYFSFICKRGVFLDSNIFFDLLDFGFNLVQSLVEVDQHVVFFPLQLAPIAI